MNKEKKLKTDKYTICHTIKQMYKYKNKNTTVLSFIYDGLLTLMFR